MSEDIRQPAAKGMNKKIDKSTEICSEVHSETGAERFYVFQSIPAQTSATMRGTRLHRLKHIEPLG